jgi:hypothetical protein
LDRETYIATILGIATALILCLLIAYQSPIQSGEFAIILTLNNTKVVSDSDIIHYNITSHEFILTRECTERLKTMGWRLAESNFTIVVNGNVELSGIFVPPVVSRTYPSSQVVITYPNIMSSTGSMNFEVMKLQMGYPWNQPISSDPRNNPRIAEYFERSGRLIR